MSGRKQWRLLGFASYDAATNMAVDEAILEAHLKRLVPPTLRLYGFTPPAVSIGLTQSLSLELAAGARRKGFDLVRRPTGGRAVLHLDDLTYAFVGSGEDAGLSASVRAAYKEICRGLQEAFAALGLELELGSAQSGGRQLQDCFLAITGSDLHVGGKKMVGSAQLRRKGAVLQHGSILLEQEQQVMPDLLGQGSLAGAQRHANLFEAAGRRFEMAELQAAIKYGFESAFDADFVLSELTQEEKNLLAEIRPKYLQVDRETCLP